MDRIYSMYERTATYETCFVRPNFVPRKAGQDADKTFQSEWTENELSSASQSVADTGTLTVEQKESLLDRLHHGKGNLTLQEWDDFLADLVDLDLISNTDRMYANGFLADIPEDALHGGVHVTVTYGASPDEFLWEGDPVKWLNDIDLYLFKEGLYAEMDRKSTAGISNQKASCQKVAQILKEILL